MTDEPLTSLPPSMQSVARQSTAATLTQTRPDPSLTHVLDVDRVTIAIRGKTIVSNISFWIPKGEFVCLCGPNGAGKSTLLKSILGLIPLTSGTISIGGQSVAAGHHKIGYVPQRKAFDRDFPARAVDLIVAALRGRWPAKVLPAERERARAVLAKIGGERLLDKSLSGLSGGETQRVFLARALITDPSLIILDEPTAGVDARGRAELLELMTTISRSDELAAILVTHNLAAVAQTARAHRLHRGGPAAVLGPAATSCSASSR